ncbi:type IV secretion system protein VirB10 [Phenylobacterium sp.]|uniref:type IV secretion system protein VirB10 n=1 Tax=Phenylobacterium sp. TaxID=1871053 RepID=UPI00120B72E6|nr:type IV secretion system protein VirB10 [Phenylobacterium sp.]THD63433.1 MAG: TrbI/VirB10 family protein [Phenylobacterium sp.]
MTDPKPKALSAEPVSEVFNPDHWVRPQVVQPSSPWTVVLGLAGAALLGVAVFTSLSGARQAHASTTQASAQSTATPGWAGAVQALGNEPPAAPASAPAPPPPAPAPAAVQPPPSPLDQPETHWRAPAMVVDLSDAGSAGAASPAPLRLAQAQAPVAGGAAAADGPNAEERFAARVSGGGNDTARATQMHDVSRIVPQGFVIPAVLETAIDSDLPGSVRAVVSRDVRGFDGAQVLIPRGSHLIGQYKSAAAIGQTRAFVVWSRIITPQGVSIDVGSPATDRLGRGGLEGKADSHFFERFGSSILLSVISGGIEAAANSGGGTTNALIIGSPTQAQNVAAIALQKQIDIPTTIKVAQGAPVQVSVARDLDFSGVAPAR